MSTPENECTPRTPGQQAEGHEEANERGSYQLDPEEFLRLFDGQRDAYLRDDGDGIRSERRPLDVDVLRAHLAGDTRIGVYTNFGRDGSFAGFGVLDVDFDDFEIVLTLQERARQVGADLLIERSRRKGWHLWLFCDAAMPAAKLRRFLTSVRDETFTRARYYVEHRHPELDPSRKVEVFPKHDSLPTNGLGNGVLLPLHGGSLRVGRTAFYDGGDDGTPHLIDTWTPTSARRVSEEQVDAALAELQPAARAQTGIAVVAESMSSRPDPRILEGERSNRIFALARRAADVGLMPLEVLAAIRTANEKRCVNADGTPAPLSDSELQSIVASATSAKYVQRDSDAIAADRPIAFIDFAAIAAKGLPERKWLIPGWLDETDLALLAQQPGTGKTTIAAALAISIASGQPWCGIRPMRTGTVLVIDEEQSLDEVYRVYVRSGAPLPGLHVASGQGINLVTEQGRTRLERMIAERRPILVILDSFTQVFLGIDENDAAAVAEAFHWLHAMRDTYRVAFLIIHHLRKPPAQGRLDALNLVRGSTVLGAQASTVWVGSPAGKDVLEVVQAKRRGGEKTTLRVGYATEPGDYGRITLTGEGPVDATDTISQRACDLVLRLLEYKGEARTKEIIESIDRDGINLQATKRALKFLVSVGKLTKPMRGCYRIAENAEGTDNDAE